MRSQMVSATQMIRASHATSVTCFASTAAETSTSTTLMRHWMLTQRAIWECSAQVSWEQASSRQNFGTAHKGVTCHVKVHLSDRAVARSTSFGVQEGQSLGLSPARASTFACSVCQVGPPTMDLRADVVIEAVFEDLSLIHRNCSPKSKNGLDAHALHNTSSLPIASIAVRKHPENVVMRRRALCVHTCDGFEVSARVVKLARRMGKHVIVVNDSSSVQSVAVPLHD